MPRHAITPGHPGDEFRLESPNGEGHFGLYVHDGADRVDLEAPNTMPTGAALCASYYEDGVFAGWVSVGGVSDHGALTGLSDDDHSIYALLAGRITPQQFAFGTGSGATAGKLTSTSHATKGKYSLNAAGTIVVDEANVRFGIGRNDPTEMLELASAVVGTFTNSTNLRFTYTLQPNEYHNDIYNMISGTAADHCMEFRVKSNGVETRSLRLVADGSSRFSGKVGINIDTVTPTAPAGTLEISDAALTDATHLVMSYSPSQNFSNKIKNSFLGGDDPGNRMKFFVTQGDGSTDVNVLTLFGDKRLTMSAPATAPVDANLLAGQISFYLDESGHNLKVRVKYADGTTLKFGTLALA